MYVKMFTLFYTLLDTKHLKSFQACFFYLSIMIEILSLNFMYIVLLVVCLSLYIQLGSEFSYSLTNT